MAKKSSAARQVTVDEAVIEAGGKPSSDFRATVEAALGVTASNETKERAAEHFDRRLVRPTRALISLKQLLPMRTNPRASIGDVSELVRSIETNGFLGSLFVREVTEGGDPRRSTEEAPLFEVWAGNRRLEAARKAGLEEVPCDIYELTEVQALELNMTEQVNREQLTPTEEGEACRRLQELAGYDVAQVAAKLGRSPSWVRGRLALTAAAPEVREALRQGEVPLTLATALAALPTTKMQAQGLDVATAKLRCGDTVDDAIADLRESYCRPLKGAPWKLTDETLVPEAGACSACPKNTQNERAPGLFDNVKAPPTCTDLPCYESKVRAAWAKRTAKYREQGARVLGVSEGTKLFTVYDGKVRLTNGSKYVFANEVAQQDGSKRTWSQLVERIADEAARPVLHVAQDAAGGIHELYVGDKALEAVAAHLELKWAKKAVEREARGGDAADARDDFEAQRREREVVRRVTDEVRRTVAERIAVKGLTLPQARAMASAVDDGMVQAFLEARGAKDTGARGVKQLRASAVVDELLALLFFATAWSSWDGVDEGLVELAKTESLDLKAMAKAHASALDAEKGGK